MADQQGQIDLALALGHYSAGAVSVLAAAQHRGKPIGDEDIKHLLSLLATAAATAPEVAKAYFESLAATVAGKHYEASETKR